LTLVNKYSVENDKDTLTLNSKLKAAAYCHSTWINTTEIFSHTKGGAGLSGTYSTVNLR
jgi:hypothetical protein